MKVHTYENSSGKDLIKKYIDKLSKEEQVDGYSVLHACRKQKNKTETTDKNIVISRIENKENSPTLKTLCSILDVLGYEIKFEPKQRV